MKINRPSLLLLLLGVALLLIPVTSAFGAYQPGDMTALLLVRQNTPQGNPPGAAASYRRIARQDAYFRQVASRCNQGMLAAGLRPANIRIITAASPSARAMAHRLWLNLDRSPFVGLVTVDANGNPQRVVYSLQNADLMDVNSVVDQLTAQWIQKMAFLKQPRTYQVTMRVPNGNFLTAINGGGSAVNANGASVGEWETFVMTDTTGAELMSGNSVSFLTSKQFFVSAKENGGQGLDASQRAKGEWETFRIRKVGPDASPEIHSGDQIAIEAGQTRYWTAENGGGGKVNAKGVAPGAWETFVIQMK